MTRADERAAAVELQSWYQVRLRPRLVRAVELGLVDPRRALTLDDDLRVLIGRGGMPSLGTAEGDR